MKTRSLSLVLAAVLLTACAPLDTYYKPGVSVADLNRATTTCKVEALRQVPTSTQVRQAPPSYVPARRVCRAANQCRVLPGYYVPGPLITYDPNEGLRRQVEGQCMADRGFAPVSIPACPDAVARSVPQRATTTLPPLNEKSCVIRYRSGRFQIVTRR